MVCLFVGCLTSQQHASVSQGRICTDNFTCCKRGGGGGVEDVGVYSQIGEVQVCVQSSGGGGGGGGRGMGGSEWGCRCVKSAGGVRGGAVQVCVRSGEWRTDRPVFCHDFGI